MNHRIGFPLLFLPVAALALAMFEPSPRCSSAQESDARRADDDDDSGGRGEGRGRGGRGGRGQFGRGQGGELEGGGFGGRRGQFGRGQAQGEGAAEGGRFGGRGRGQFGPGGAASEGEEGGRFNFRRGAGENAGRGEVGGGRGRGRGGENQNEERSTSDRPERRADGQSAQDAAESARALMRRQDKSGDMMLQAEEQKGLTGKAAAADGNKDGIITIDEMTTALSTSTPTARAESRGDDQGGEDRGRRGNADERRGGDASATAKPGAAADAADAKTSRVYTALPPGGAKAKDVKAPRTYRFSKGADRLPTTGLPSWFASRDTNNDGQVAMNEYSRTWSDRTVGDFRRYDLNDDGIVTANEAKQR